MPARMKKRPVEYPPMSPLMTKASKLARAAVGAEERLYFGDGETPEKREKRDTAVKQFEDTMRQLSNDELDTLSTIKLLPGKDNDQAVMATAYVQHTSSKEIDLRRDDPSRIPPERKEPTKRASASRPAPKKDVKLPDISPSYSLDMIPDVPEWHRGVNPRHKDLDELTAYLYHSDGTTPKDSESSQDIMSKLMRNKGKNAGGEDIDPTWPKDFAKAQSEYNKASGDIGAMGLPGQKLFNKEPLEMAAIRAEHERSIAETSRNSARSAVRSLQFAVNRAKGDAEEETRLKREVVALQEDIAEYPSRYNMRSKGSRAELKSKQTSLDTKRHQLALLDPPAALKAELAKRLKASEKILEEREAQLELIKEGKALAMERRASEEPGPIKAENALREEAFSKANRQLLKMREKYGWTPNDPTIKMPKVRVSNKTSSKGGKAKTPVIKEKKPRKVAEAPSPATGGRRRARASDSTKKDGGKATKVNIRVA